MKKIWIIAGLLICLMLAGCSRKNEEGLTCLQEGRYEEAIEVFQESIDDQKDVAEAYRGQGIAYWELEQYEASRTAFREALANGAEETASIYNFIGSCSMQLGQYEEAISSFELGIGLGDGGSELDQEMAFNQIAAYEKIGDYESAKVRLSSYLEKYPDDAEAAKEAEFLETR